MFKKKKRVKLQKTFFNVKHSSTIILSTTCIHTSHKHFMYSLKDEYMLTNGCFQVFVKDKSSQKNTHTHKLMLVIIIHTKSVDVYSTRWLEKKSCIFKQIH